MLATSSVEVTLPALTYGIRGSPKRGAADLIESHGGLYKALRDKDGAWLRRHVPYLRTLVVLHPGNPGVPQFYEEFISECCRKDHATAVMVLGFVGHTLEQRSGDGVFDLQDQVEAADDFWRSIAAAVPESPLKSVVVAGHSIGSHVALHVAARHAWITKALLLTPTIANMAVSPNGRRNGRLLNAAFIEIAARVVAPVLSKLPVAVKGWLVRRSEPRMTARQHTIVQQMPRPLLVKNVLCLAKTEFEQVRDLDVELLKHVGRRAFLYFVHDDGWVPFTDLGLMEAASTEATLHVEHDRDVKHAWCCGASNIVADAVVRAARH